MFNPTKELTPVEYGSDGVKRMHFNVKANNRCFQLHWHDRMELIKLNSGTMLIDIGDESVKLHSGDIYIVPPKVPHTAFSTSDVLYDVIMFDIRVFFNDTDLSEKYLEPIFKGAAKFATKTDNQEIVECYEKIIAGPSGLESLGLIYKLISLLFRNCLLELNNRNNEDSLITSAIKYIEEHYKENISTKQIANYFGYSSEHFLRKFKNVTWLTPMKYLQIYRLEVSAELLKESPVSIAEISALSGMSDSNYFTRCFTAHFGTSPTKYRKLHAKIPK